MKEYAVLLIASAAFVIPFASSIGAIVRAAFAPLIGAFGG